MSLTLTIKKCSLEISPSSSSTSKDTLNPAVTNNGSEALFQSSDTFGNSYSLGITLKSIEYHKKMYAPCEIIADLQVTLKINGDVNSLSRAELQKLFDGKEVELMEGSDTIAIGYYVQEIIPRKEKTSTSNFVTLKIYSPDKLWTLDKYSRSYVAKRLYNDILLDNTEADISKTQGMARLFTLPYDSSKEFSTLLSMQTLNMLGNSTTEQILPYLVQYNETFYDFLVRTANRWGEFLYYEDDKLYFGYKDPGTAKELKSYKSVSEYSTKQGSPLTINMHSHNVKNPSTMATVAQKSGNIVDEVTTDEYRTAIDNTEEYYSEVVGEMFHSPGNKYFWRKMGDLFLRNTNLVSWLSTFAIDDVLSLETALNLHKQKVKKYKDKYFAGSFSSQGVNSGNNLQKEQYDMPSGKTAPEDATKLYMFATAKADSGPTAENYKTVLDNETEAGKNLIRIDLGPTYIHKRLGDTIYIGNDSTTEYMIIQIDCVTESSTVYSINTKKVTLKDKDGNSVEVEVIDNSKMKNGIVTETSTTVPHFQMIAVKKSSKGWYPPIHENGHVRTSGPQLAYVTDNDDPDRNLRYRVKYAWQSADESKDMASPWLTVAYPWATDQGGAFFKYQKNDQVLLNYEAGNIERPYIVGALQNKENTIPREARTNAQTFVTPGGQSIRMYDGKGFGLSAFFASFNPVAKLIQGFCKPSTPAEDASKNYEGSIELTDKFGLYSIKASTNDRNVTIKSVFGDVKINAFTGITVSAPNGDVKIEGKNVSIEAGNNLTLKSGTNIKNGFWGNVHEDFKDWGESALTQLAMTGMQKTVTYLDLTILRHTWETLLKPIEGTLQIKSGRFLKLEAGKGSANIPVDLLSNEAFSTSDPDVKGYVVSYEMINGTAHNMIECYLQKRETCKARIQEYQQAVADGNHANDCNTVENLLATLWAKGNDQAVNNDDLAFQGNLADDHINSLEDAQRQPLRADKNELLRRARQLLIEMKRFKSVIRVSNGTNKPFSQRLNGNVHNRMLRDALEHQDHTAFFEMPADGQGATLLAFFTNSDNDITRAANRNLAKILGISTAAKYIQAQGGVFSMTPSALHPVPTDFTVANANLQQQWEDYVNGLSFGDKGGLAAKLRGQMEDMTINKTAFFSNTNDADVWGGDNRAAILLSSDNDTYMLDANGQLAKSYGVNNMRSYYTMSVGMRNDYTLNKIKAALRNIEG